MFYLPLILHFVANKYMLKAETGTQEKEVKYVQSQNNKQARPMSMTLLLG